MGISALRTELDKKPSLILSTIDTFTDSKVKTEKTTGHQSSNLDVRFVRSC